MPAKEKRRSTGADDGRVVLNLTKSSLISGYESSEARSFLGSSRKWRVSNSALLWLGKTSVSIWLLIPVESEDNRIRKKQTLLFTFIHKVTIWHMTSHLMNNTWICCLLQGFWSGYIFSLPWSEKTKNSSSFSSVVLVDAATLSDRRSSSSAACRMSSVFKTHSLLGGSPVYRVSRDFRASNLDIAIANIGPKIWQNHLLWW